MRTFEFTKQSAIRVHVAERRYVVPQICSRVAFGYIRAAQNKREIAHMRSDITEVVTRISSVIATRTRLQLPAVPDVLAVCLGLALEPRPDARAHLKRRTFVYCAESHGLLQRRDISVACAMRAALLFATRAERKALGREGYILLARALCG